MTQAKNIVRHSVVEYEGKLYMIETKHSKGYVLLVPAKGVGKEIKSSTMLEVVMFPAQLAVHFLSINELPTV